MVSVMEDSIHSASLPTCSSDEGNFNDNGSGTARPNSRPSQWRCNKFNVTIEPVVCMFCISTSICEVIIINLFMERTCEIELHFNQTECSFLGSNTAEGERVEALVQPYASVLLTAKNLIYSVLPAVMSLFLGPWSDYNGRKFLLLSSMIGLAISYSTYAALAYFPNIPAVYFLLASLPFSFCGGYTNFFSAAYSYISDVSSEESQTLRLGLVEASVYVGVLVGVITSYQVFSIDKHFGYVITLSIGATGALLAFLYTFYFIPESVQRNEDSADGKSVIQLKFLKEIFTASFKARENYGRTVICLCLIIMTTTIVTMEGESNLFYLFTRLQFGWKLPQYTVWSAVRIGTTFIGLLFGLIVLTNLLKVPDMVLVAISFAMKLSECLFYAFLQSGSQNLMYCAPLVGFLGAVAAPTLRSVVSKTVPKVDVGKVFFLVTCCESLFPLALTPVYTVLYNATLSAMPGAIFMLSASFYFADLILCSVILILGRRVAKRQYVRVTEDDNGSGLIT